MSLNNVNAAIRGPVGSNGTRTTAHSHAHAHTCTPALTHAARRRETRVLGDMGAKSSPYVCMGSCHLDDGGISIYLYLSISICLYLRDMGAKSSLYVCMGSCNHDDGGGRRDQDCYSQPPRLRNSSIHPGVRGCDGCVIANTQTNTHTQYYYHTHTHTHTHTHVDAMPVSMCGQRSGGAGGAWVAVSSACAAVRAVDTRKARAVSCAAPYVLSAASRARLNPEPLNPKP
jgi:hypothetical protein